MMPGPDDPNILIVAQRASAERERPADPQMLQYMLERTYTVRPVEPVFAIAGIDSSDNMLLRIPGQPGAGVAGYSYALSVCGPDGRERAWQDRSVEREAEDHPEQLEIDLVYSLPTREERRLLHMADYQFRSLMTSPGGRSPYDDLDNPGEYKLRFAAAREREITERRAIRTYLNQDPIPAPLLLKDGRLSAQNCSTRYMDNLGRLAVRRDVRLVGVVKEGSRLWNDLYPYHTALAAHHRGAAYWAELPAQLIADGYTVDQWTPKTLHLGARENQSLGGIGGLWVLYSPGPATYYIIEFNVYDLAEYRPLVESHVPLDLHNRERFGWQSTYVALWSEEIQDFEGTQQKARQEDFERLVIPTLEQIHHLATITRVTENYPVVLADAHHRCKITRDRKDRKNAELIAELTRRGFHPVDFETWSEDPHKLYEV